jgi:hypothetical protein
MGALEMDGVGRSRREFTARSPFPDYGVVHFLPEAPIFEKRSYLYELHEFLP